MSELKSVRVQIMLVVTLVAAAILGDSLLRGVKNDPIDLGKISTATTPASTPTAGMLTTASMLDLKRCLRAQGFSVHATTGNELAVVRGDMPGLRLRVYDALAGGQAYVAGEGGVPAQWGVVGNVAFSRTDFSGAARAALRSQFFGCLPQPAAG